MIKDNPRINVRKRQVTFPKVFRHFVNALRPFVPPNDHESLKQRVLEVIEDAELQGHTVESSAQTRKDVHDVIAAFVNQNLTPQRLNAASDDDILLFVAPWVHWQKVGGHLQEELKREMHRKIGQNERTQADLAVQESSTEPAPFGTIDFDADAQRDTLSIYSAKIHEHVVPPQSGSPRAATDPDHMADPLRVIKADGHVDDARYFFGAGYTFAMWGSGGTGKSTMAEFLRDCGRANGLNVIGTGFHGVSAARADPDVGRTVYSLFKITPSSAVHQPDLMHGDMVRFEMMNERGQMLQPRPTGKMRDEAFELISTADVIWIDEVFQAQALALDSFNRLCQLVRLDPRPCGGIQMIFTGDQFQTDTILSRPDHRSSVDDLQENLRHYDGASAFYSYTLRDFSGRLFSQHMADVRKAYEEFYREKGYTGEKLANALKNRSEHLPPDHPVFQPPDWKDFGPLAIPAIVLSKNYRNPRDQALLDRVRVCAHTDYDTEVLVAKSRPYWTSHQAIRSARLAAENRLAVAETKYENQPDHPELKAARADPDLRGADDFAVVLTSTNAERKAFNKEYLDRLPGDLYEFPADIVNPVPKTHKTGKGNDQARTEAGLYKELRVNLNLQLKPGAVVMMTRNNNDPESASYYNGMLGVVTGFDGPLVDGGYADYAGRDPNDPNDPGVKVWKPAPNADLTQFRIRLRPVDFGELSSPNHDEPGRGVDAEPSDRDIWINPANLNYESRPGIGNDPQPPDLRQFSLTLAHGMTIHKSQGNTIGGGLKVLLMLNLFNGFIRNGPFYTGISRPENLNQLTLGGDAETMLGQMEPDAEVAAKLTFLDFSQRAGELMLPLAKSQCLAAQAGREIPPGPPEVDVPAGQRRPLPARKPVKLDGLFDGMTSDR